MRLVSFVLVALLFFSCRIDDSKTESSKTPSTNQNAIPTKDFREFKVLDSKYIDNEFLWQPFDQYWESFTQTDYELLKPLILEQNIPTLQKHISNGKLSYEQLTLFYLYRIKKFDRNNELSLNSVIALNYKVVEQAKEKDKHQKNKTDRAPIFGMPILLKDNVNASGMPTTAGAVVLQTNFTDDAFIVKQLKANGALILGKTNLSEWAYFFCGDCPSGYSAIGGQTLNPYGRRIFDTGGSSSGSGVASAANFAVATVGTETSGSILSPSSQNSNVGLKPTIGLLSRTGIVPISSTLDTPGPITKNVIDNAIMMDAMLGYDKTDNASIEYEMEGYFYGNLLNSKTKVLKGKRFGAFKEFLKDTLYTDAIKILKKKGAVIIEIDELDFKRNGFRTLLNMDMRIDLPMYLNNHASKTVTVASVQNVIDYNIQDSINVMPYGQKLFYGIVNDKTSEVEFQQIKDSLNIKGKMFFDIPMKEHQLDGVLSINNSHAGHAAVAKYPALTVPMGYTNEGAPKGLTFISKPWSESQLLEWAYAYEQASKERKLPENYK